MSITRYPLLLLFVCCAGRLHAADHHGVVQSATLPVPGATVTAMQGEKKVQTTTDDAGAYAFPELAEGVWTVEIEMPAFVKIAGEIAVPGAGTATEWNLKMIGATETQAPRPLPRAAAPQRTSTQYSEMALSASAPVPATPSDDASLEMAANANEALLVGGGVSPVRGSSTPKYNGSAGLSLDNSVWDARAYSFSGQKMDKPSFAKARTSATFGGPLRIPKLISGEHTSFTVGYNGGRTRNWSSFTSTMPTELERRGDFSQSVQRGPVTIYDPLNGQPFPNNRIPASRLSPAATALTRYMPLPNQPGQVRNYQFVTAAPANQDSLNATVNHRFNRRHRVSGNVSVRSSENVWPQLIGVNDANEVKGWNASLSWNATLAPRLISTARFSFNLQRNTTSPYFAFRENVAAELGITGTAMDPINWGPPNVAFTNFGGIGAANASRTANQTGTFAESVVWNRGKHNLSFGFDYTRRQMNRVADLNARGSLSFTGLATSASGEGGFDFADFLLGLPNTSSVRFGGGDTYFRSNGYGAFLQDDWRVGARVTVNLGLRYDYASPVTEKYGRMANLAIAPGFADASLVTGSGTLPQADRNNVSPRLAAAWRPSSRTSAVVRAGYGWYFNTNIYGGVADNLAQQPPFAKTSTVASSADRVLTIQNAFAGTLSRQTANTYAVDPRYRIGYAQSWNLSVQQNLGRLLVGEVTYLGTKGAGLDMLSIPNRFLPSGVAPFIYESSDGSSIYHGGSARVSRRFSGGLTAQLRYTYSKSIDNASSVTGSGSGWIVQDAFNFAAERGLSSFDTRHALEGNWQWTLRKKWIVSSTMTYRSGSPLTPTVLGNRADISGTGITGTIRADATGLPIRAEDGFFNLRAFDVPAAGQFGNAGRGTIPGPGMFQMNGSVSRSFSLGERRAVELRVDGNNVLNHVNILRFGTVVNASNYGLATGAGGMRSLNMHMRFRF